MGHRMQVSVARSSPSNHPIIREPSTCSNRHSSCLPWFAQLKRQLSQHSPVAHHGWLKPGIPGPAVFHHPSGSRHLQAALGHRSMGTGSDRGKAETQTGRARFFWKSMIRIPKDAEIWWNLDTPHNSLDISEPIAVALNVCSIVQHIGLQDFYLPSTSEVPNELSMIWKPHQLLSDASMIWNFQ